MKKIIIRITSLFLLLLATSTASAISIDGTINFTGGGVVTVDSSGLAVETVTFNTITVSDDSFLQTGDFSGLDGTTAAFTDFDISDALPTVLWTVGDFTFEITSVLLNTVDLAGTFIDVTLMGTGIISAVGFDDTAAEWIITANGSETYVSFSSTALSSVPAPAGAALLGLCLLGFGLARRNKQVK
ncbi:hypothetical protein DS885_13290 [Psychromonas sp. B3M02]|uniref:hypothetical protein n=1 Tax=unclassified Psychromonas TaxID=2614957 RepID=UPI000DEA6E37|nr:hypothetical protein [Psychromonas sp. B3M02]RBW43614.1 hypothetical protein DS885_13290 [Psychromonas sp. B3M02]